MLGHHLDEADLVDDLPRLLEHLADHGVGRRLVPLQAPARQVPAPLGTGGGRELGEQQRLVGDDDRVGGDALPGADRRVLRPVEPGAARGRGLPPGRHGDHLVPEHEVVEHPADGDPPPAPAAGGETVERVLPVPEDEGDDLDTVPRPHDGDHERAPARRYSRRVFSTVDGQS